MSSQDSRPSKGPFRQRIGEAVKRANTQLSAIERIRKFADIAGYSSPEEFITHALEKELAQLEDADSEEEIKKRLQGLGYMS